MYHRMTAKFASHANVPKEKGPSMILTGSKTSSSSSTSSSKITEGSASKPPKRKGFFKRFAPAKSPERATSSTAEEKGKLPGPMVEGSDDVLEVWFSGCHGGKSCHESA